LFEVVPGGLKNPGNYMETDVASKTMFVNAEWLKRLQHAPEKELKLHNHLLFVKGLHEVAHMLTPDFLDWCEKQGTQKTKKQKRKHGKEEKKDTPVKIGTKRKKAKGSTQGDAGYGLEEALSGGRLFHVQISDPNTAWKFSRLVVKKLEKSRWQNYNVPESFYTPKKDTLEAYKPKNGRKTDPETLAKSIRKGAGPLDDCVHGGPTFALYEPDDFTVEGRKT
jgi:hypothetical protein